MKTALRLAVVGVMFFAIAAIAQQATSGSPLIQLLQSKGVISAEEAAQIARLTGSRRRISSSACDSANKLMRIGMRLKSGQRGPQGDRELRRDMFHFAHLLRRQRDLQEIQRVPRLAVHHQFGL